MAAKPIKPKASNEGVIPIEEVEVTPVGVDTTAEEETPVAVATSPEEDGKTATVTFEDTKSTPIQKNVKIRPRVNHSCNIGGVAYHFEKGKQYNVPENVKSILLQADLLMPL